uniref:Uncharacterized protein n=1 Tax=Globodera rostochiensis TaxID=31243 RepID=A0A914IA24_GLORO
MSAGHDKESILRCITNLCANLDADLVNALLDDDQLLTEDRQSLLASVVKAFRQLHSQLKEEISCAMSGHIYCGTFPIRLLSILEKDQQNQQNEEQPMSSADAEQIAQENLPLAELPNCKASFFCDGMGGDGVEPVEEISLKEAPSSRKHWEIEEHAATSQRNALEFQFIDAVSICPVGREREGDVVNRSVQVESDLYLSSSPSASFSRTKLKTVDGSNFCSDGTEKNSKNEKNDEISVESVSAASVYNGKESSFSTTTTMNSTNSTENSVGEIDRRNVTRLMATKSDIKLHSADAEGALLTFTGKRKTQRKSAAPSTSTREKRGESHCFGRSPNSSVVTTPQSFCQSSVSMEAAIKRHSAVLERNSEPIAPLTTNGRRHSQEEDDLVEVLSAKTMAKGDGRRRSLAVRDVSFHSSFDTTNLLNALVEERATGDKKENINEHGNRREIGEEEEEQSTLNQVTPIPTTLELSNSI